jgi:hypothetical protein
MYQTHMCTCTGPVDALRARAAHAVPSVLEEAVKCRAHDSHRSDSVYDALRYLVKETNQTI